MKEIIYTRYKTPAQKRGTLDGTTFRRDNTPLVRTFQIMLEVDVIEQLDKKGCKELVFNVRKPKCQVRCYLSDFKEGNLVEMGYPDKRWQRAIYYKPFMVKGDEK